MWNLPPKSRKAAETKFVAGVSLHGGPERPLSEAVKVKPGFPWRPQDVEDARAMRYLPGRAADTEWNQTKREKYVNKAERSGRFEELANKPFDIRNSYRI